MTDRNPSNEREDDAWLTRIRSELDASARDLDAATLSRLNRARQRALSEAPRPRWRWPLAMAGAASCALALALALRTTAPAEVPMIEQGVQGAEDFELLTDGDDIALYSDLEFYAWLDSQDPEA
jgi:hypothetical protein